MDNSENIKSMLDAGRAVGTPFFINPGSEAAPLLVVPDGYEAVFPDSDEAEKWLAKPVRKRGTFSFADVDSFIRYFMEHATPDSRIDAHISDTGIGFTGHVNFHGKEPSWNDHNCVVQMRPTHEWSVWCNSNNVAMSQTKFAQFLEDNADMFVDPPGAQLSELVTTLEGKSHVDFSQAVKLQTGAVNLKFTETIELKGGVAGPQSGDMQIPKTLKVSIAPFEGTPRYEIMARLRFRIQDRKLTLWYEAVAPHLVVRTIAADLLKVIETKTNVQPFRV